MARGDSAIRLLKVIMYLERAPQGLTVREIHSRLENEGIECSERTVYRDLDVIQGAHFPLASTGDDSDLSQERRYRFNRTTALSEKVHFESHEIFALYLARESLKAMRGSPLIDDILSLTAKLERVLGPSVEKELRNLSGYVTYRAQATWQTGVSQETLDTIYRACWDRVILEIEYKSKSGSKQNQVTKRELGPETLYFANGGAYLIACDLSDGVTKFFSLSRIFSANYTDREYASTGFDLKSFVKENFGLLSAGETQDVVISIREPIASFVSERKWHESQKITRTENGIEFSMRVRVNDELVRWVLGLGDCATVTSPPVLQDILLKTVTGLQSQYAYLKKAS